MLKFQVFRNGELAQQWPLRNAYAMDSYGNAIPSEISIKDGIICVERKDGEHGPFVFALQHRVGQLGELALRTTLLPPREEPYVLVVELARYHLMTLYNRLEEWSMFELPVDHAVPIRTKIARDAYVEALTLQVTEPANAQRRAQESLINATDGSEELVLAHAELLINRRYETKAMPKCPLGCGVALEVNEVPVLSALQQVFDYVRLPMPWCKLVPDKPSKGKEDYNWTLTDQWLVWAKRANMNVCAGPLFSFDKNSLPDWVKLAGDNFEALRDAIYDHVTEVVSRYAKTVHTWNIASGIHVLHEIPLSPEQMMDLMRTIALVVRKRAPQSRIMVEVREPWGEYVARDSTLVSPKPFIDMLLQLNIPFDDLGLYIPMGQPVRGQRMHDLMALSTLVDQFGHIGKSLHITIGVPSATVTTDMLRPHQRDVEGDLAGFWRKEWDEQVQGHFLEAAMNICLCRPYVESVAWIDVVDHGDMQLPMSGLMTNELKNRKGLRRMMHFRNSMIGKKAQAQAVEGEATAAKK